MGPPKYSLLEGCLCVDIFCKESNTLAHSTEAHQTKKMFYTIDHESPCG